MNQSGAHIPKEVTKSHMVNTVIHNLLLAAEKEYVRYLDFFSEPYYLNSPEKRDLAAKRYALLKVCNELTESKTYTIKQVFEACKGFESVSRKRYETFSVELKEFHQNGATACINKRFGKKCFLDPQVEYLINNSIYNFLFEAEAQYCQYIDLFSKAYHDNPEKCELVAKQYALLKVCNELIESKTYTVKQVFEVYKGFESASIKNYKSLFSKLIEFRKNGVSACIHKRIDGHYKEKYKLNPYVANLIYEYLCQPDNYSYNRIKEWVNQSILEFNRKHKTNFSTISESTVALYYKNNRADINYQREKPTLILGQ